MIVASALPALMASEDIGEIEVGDFCWSARSSKTGWLKCEAQAVSRTTYAALFAEIGTTHGAGDGTTTFNIPDGRSRGLIGAGQGSVAESFAAAAVNTGTDVITIASNANNGMQLVENTGGGAAHNNMQPFLAANLFIYTGV